MRNYTWFAEPKGDVSYTNQVLAKNANGEEDALQDVLCADGQRHNLWRISSGQIFMLWRSRVNLRIQFAIWCKEGNGKIRNVTRLYKNDRGSSKKKKQRKLSA